MNETYENFENDSFEDDPRGGADFPYDLAAFDLDGTLMRFDQTISTDTVSALDDLRSLGVRVVLATGRRYEGACENALRLGFGRDEPLISYGGAMVRSMSGETLLFNTLDNQTGVAALRWAEERGIQSRIMLDGMFVASGGQTGVKDTISLLEQDDVEKVEVPSEWLSESGMDPVKITFVDSPASVEEWLPGMSSEFSSGAFVTRSLPHYVEIGPGEGKKSVALDFLCERWGISPKRCIAFGDGENDMDMLRFVGHGVAVGGGMSRAVRDSADAVTGSVDEEGVANYLRKLLGETR